MSRNQTARDFTGRVFQGGGAVFLARIVDAQGDPITRAGITAIAYTLFRLNPNLPGDRAAIAGHSDVAVDPLDVLWDLLQTDASWNVDTVGYNFRHALRAGDPFAFAAAGAICLLEYRLTTSEADLLLVRFRLNVI